MAPIAIRMEEVYFNTTNVAKAINTKMRVGIVSLKKD
jgi:hypothetical protein